MRSETALIFKNVSFLSINSLRLHAKNLNTE